MTYIADGGDSLTLMAGPFDLTGQSVIPGTETCRMEVLAEGFDFGDSIPEARARASQLRDGSRESNGPFPNATATFPVLFSAEDSVDLRRGIAAVWRWCHGADTYTWQHPDGYGVPTTFDVQRAWLSGQADDLDMLRIEERRTLNLVCLPFGRSPEQRTSPSFPATGVVQQAPVVGSARTDASVEIVGVDQFSDVLVFSHPSLASGFQPRLTPVGSEAKFRVPVANLPEGGFLLLGPHVVDSSQGANPVTRIEVTATTYLGDPAAGAVAVQSQVISDRPPATDPATNNLQLQGAFHLPDPKVSAATGVIELTVRYTTANGSVVINPSGFPQHSSGFLLLPMEEDAALTTVTGLRTNTTRVWMDLATPTRPYDEISEGSAADRSDSIAIRQITRWRLPSFLPGVSSQANIVVFVGRLGTPKAGATWSFRYWPKWLGVAPE